ncbi:MAG: hypothetical protein HY866_09990 [Chloroflexi bacterium]|nr:hypothetical protein [Chloroflexota bacterium]
MSPKKQFTAVLLIILLVLSASAHAQEGPPAFTDPVSIQSSGVLGPENTVFYSVLLATGADEVANLTITSALPEGATFLDVFWTPKSAVYGGESGGTVTWTLDTLPRDTIIGPFTFQVSFDEKTTAIPYNVPAAVRWEEGESSARVVEATLEPLAATGSITVDENGTAGLVPVEDTGVFMLVPPGTYNEAVTFTFERLPIAEDTPLPDVAEETWWCALYNVTVEPADAAAALPISIFYPSRRTLTPGMEVARFVQLPEGEWEIDEQNKLVSKPAAQEAKIPGGIVSPSGNQIIAILIGVVPAPNFNTALGVSVQLRANGITDGTSNTIAVLGYIEQDNLIVNWNR